MPFLTFYLYAGGLATACVFTCCMEVRRQRRAKRNGASQSSAVPEQEAFLPLLEMDRPGLQVSTK
jgi:hypothetical protein